MKIINSVLWNCEDYYCGNIQVAGTQKKFKSGSFRHCHCILVLIIEKEINNGTIQREYVECKVFWNYQKECELQEREHKNCRWRKQYSKCHLSSMYMGSARQAASSGCWQAWPKTSLWNALCIFYFYMDCWTVSFIAVLMIGVWSAYFIFSWWFLILKNLLEAACKCNLFCTAKVCLILTSQSENQHQNITWLQRAIIFHLFIPRDKRTFIKTPTFISKTKLIPGWKSRPNPLCIFVKLQIGLEPSKTRVFRAAWLVNFRWNRSSKRGHGFSLSGANWLEANLGMVMVL